MSDFYKDLPNLVPAPLTLVLPFIVPTYKSSLPSPNKEPTLHDDRLKSQA
jgi:hypothetical protein